ncbi:MAG: N-acetyltransferase, partial [Clostridia bacterium]|nr:N-acetyltransferase [Clostridia bacterium]
RSRVESVDTVTFGPLCMEPEWQGRGVGKALLDATLPLAREAGYPGVVIFGEPDYYPLHGFKTCDKFGITTPDGRNFPAFMAYELREGALADVHGRFF